MGSKLKVKVACQIAFKSLCLKLNVFSDELNFKEYTDQDQKEEAYCCLHIHNTNLYFRCLFTNLKKKTYSMTAFLGVT